MKTVLKFIRDYKIKMTSEWANENPNMSDMPYGSSHWLCRFKCGRRTMNVHFSMGPALTGEPTIEMVLDCIANDVGGMLNAGSFEDWCGEYGYDTDSRKAERTFKLIMKRGDELAHLLGSGSAVRELAFETERL